MIIYSFIAAIIKSITLMTLYMNSMLWPPHLTLGGFLNQSLFLFLSAMTLLNFIMAILQGPSYVPFGWKPKVMMRDYWIRMECLDRQCTGSQSCPTFWLQSVMNSSCNWTNGILTLTAYCRPETRHNVKLIIQFIASTYLQHISVLRFVSFEHIIRYAANKLCNHVHVCKYFCMLYIFTLFVAPFYSYETYFHSNWGVIVSFLYSMLTYLTSVSPRTSPWFSQLSQFQLLSNNMHSLFKLNSFKVIIHITFFHYTLQTYTQLTPIYWLAEKAVWGITTVLQHLWGFQVSQIASLQEMWVKK